MKKALREYLDDSECTGYRCPHETADKHYLVGDDIEKVLNDPFPPRMYKAQTLPPETPDPFMGYKTREVQGYYVKHISATPPPISTQYERDKFIEKVTKHYIVTDGFSDWNLPREMEMLQIDINTLEEL